MKRLLLFSTLTLLIAGCSKTDMRVVKIKNVIDSLKTQFAPDPRTAVFDITARDSGKYVILSGETDRLFAKDILFSEVRKVTGENIIDSVDVLPDPNLDNVIDGIVDVSVGNIYQYPKYESQLVTQVLLGHTVRVLKRHHGWLYVQCEDKYLGWAQPGIIRRVDSSELAAYNAKDKLLVTAIYTTVRSTPVSDGGTVSDAVMADLLTPVQKSGASYKVELPDGRTGFVSSNDVDSYTHYLATHKPTADGVEMVAKRLLGFPYLWGGTSTKGVDCSGFVKTVYRMNDIKLPRDASQQVNVGEKINPGPNFENLRKGDLLFFGKKAEDGKPAKIVHVAIYLGNGYFIHSSDRVQISSLLKTDSAFDQYDLDRFVTARRILPPNESSSKN